MTLFRQQALDHFLRSSDGAVLQVGRLPYRNFCLFIVLFLLCLLAFLRWGRCAQTEVVTGVLIPARGLIRPWRRPSFVPLAAREYNRARYVVVLP